MAVVPGGSANVFARALGISPDPIEATNQLVDLLDSYRRGGSWRHIGLMDCGESWAVFTAAFAAEVIARSVGQMGANRDYLLNTLSHKGERQFVQCR